MGKHGMILRILEHLLLYAEYQFGKEIAGISYRERILGDRISNWNVDVDILHNINHRIIRIHIQNSIINNTVCDNMITPYLERSLSLLNPYLIHLHLDASNRLNRSNKDQANILLQELLFSEADMAIVCMNRHQFDAAEGHCQRCLAYSKRLILEGKEKTSLMFTAFSTYCYLRVNQGDYSSAVILAEEGYNLVMLNHDPFHPQVQEAVGILINILIAKGDYYEALRYADGK
jgi:hypothetical protein